MQNLIRFDWAVKRLLRNKSNFGILEGFLSELIGEDITIENILESESNQKNTYEKFNKVDLLVKNSKGDLIIIEVQNNYEHDYVLRILFGLSKLLVENLNIGMNYSDIKKIISVNIVYFDLGQGDDYVYHGTTSFIGIHNHDTLQLSKTQQSLYNTDKIAKIYPEYYVIKVNKFNDIAIDNLVEWIYFLKKDEIKDGFKAKGLLQAKKELDILKLSETDRKEYEHYIEHERYEQSLIVSNYKVGVHEERLRQEEKRRLEKFEIARNLIKSGVDIQIIIDSTGLSKDDIQNIKNLLP
jgi:predicted transposase/invertase (TIGR01784 family)